VGCYQGGRSSTTSGLTRVGSSGLTRVGWARPRGPTKMGGVGRRGVGGTVRSALRVARRRQTSALDCARYQNRRKQKKQTEKSRALNCCANGIFSLPGKCISEGTQLSGALYSAPANTCTSRFTSHTAVMSAYQAHHPAPPPPPEHAPAPGRPP
jgi:hypothetical protein